MGLEEFLCCHVSPIESVQMICKFYGTKMDEAFELYL